MTVRKNIVGTKYVPNGPQTMVSLTCYMGSNGNRIQDHRLRVSGVLARFRDIDFNGYRHCVNPNTPIEAIRNPARQHQSRDVNVGDNPRARTLSFGKEIEGHAIQQGSVRVNNGMQQDIGELATHSSPLERQGNQGHRTRQVNTVEPIYQESESMPMIVMEQSLGDIAWNVEADVARLATGPSYGNGELQLKFREKGPQTGGWEGIAVDVLNNGSQMSQVSGITVADARMEAFDEDYKMTSSAIESHTEYTRQPPSTDVKVCYNSTTRTLSFGKETADQAIQQGNARVNTGMQQDVGELAAHSCPLERKGSQRRTQVDKAMDSNTSRSTIAGNQPGLPTKSNTVYRRQLATHCLGYRLETKPLTGIIRLYAWREKSEGIETLKQCTDLNIAFERKSVILIECIWVFSMTSYGNGECMHAFRETGTSNHWNLSRLQERGKESSPHQFHLGKAHSNHRNLSRHPEYRLLALQQHENKKEHPTKISAPTRNAKKYCWNQICPKYLANHGSVTANGLTGLVDVLYGLERKSLDLKRLNGARRVDYYRVNRTSQRHKCTGSIEYVSLIGLQNHALQGSGVLARFRDIDFNGYRHCVNPNTPIEAIRNPARQHQSRDVNVGDNPRARTLSFGKEIEGHAIQQGSVRVNNGMQQDIGELATHSSPLERQGNQGHRTRQVNTVEPIYQESESMPMIVMEQSLGDIAWNVEADVARLATGPSYGNGELQLKFREKGPQTGGWEGIAVDVLNNGSQMSQVSGITVADARMEAFDEDYKMTSSAIESHTEYTRQPPSTDVKVCYNSTTRTLSFGKETADQAIQQGNARVNTGMQQDVGELAAHSCPLERKGSQRRTQVDKAMDSNTSRSTIAGNQPGLPTKSNTVYRRQLATHCLGYRLETKPLTGIIRLYAWREKSEGIETLKQCTDLNIAFERKSVILIECIWVFSMTSYGNGECMHAFRETGTSNHWNLSRLQERGKESSPHQFHLGKAHSNHRNLSRHPEYRLLALQQHENKKEHPTKISAPTRNAKKYCWNQICPKYLANHGSVTANGLTGLVDVLYGLERKSLDLKRLNGARRVDYYRVNRTSQRHKCTGSIEYVSLIGLQNHALQGSGVLARFRDIDFNGYRHCVNPNTPIEAIRNPARQHQSRDVNVGDNPRARTLSFGKEIEGHAIQQGSVRVNNGMQQDIGELATHSSPLERQGNQGHRTRQVNTVEPIYQESESMPMIVMEQSLGDIAWNVEADVARLATGPSYGNGELQLKFREKGPQTGGWEGIAVDVLNNGSQMSQVSGITVADARMEAFDEDYKMTSSAIESHTEYTRQPPSTDVKVCYNSTTRTLSFGKETADQAIQQGNARVNTGMQQDVGELAAHSCPLERKGSQRRTQVDKAMDSNTSRSTIAGNQPGLPTKSNTVYRRQLATHCLGYRLETKPLTGIIRLYAWREKSEGIETLKQCTDLNIAFERKSVILIECIWVFSMTSYGNGECMHAFRETGTSNHWNLSRLQERGKESSPHQFHLGKAHSNHRNLSRHPEYRLLALQQHENKKEHPTKISAPTRNAKKYCWNQICPKYLANHGSVTANGLTGLVDVLYGLERKSLDLKRLNGARRVDYYRVNRTSQRHKCTGSIEYVSLIGLQNHALQGSGVLARFRDIDFNGYRHCVNPNTPIEAIRNPARQHQSRDVNVGDNPRARTLSFGKEIEGHAIQQGSVRVNNGMQQDIGELATHSSPLERQGNQGHRTRQVNTVEPIYQESESMPMIVMEQSLGDIAWNVEADVARLATGPSYGNGELQLKFREKGPQTGGWEGIAVDVLNNGSQMSQVSGITVADARMEAFDEDYKMTSSAIESHTEYTRQPPSTDVKVCYNSTTRTLSFGKETADQAIQQGNARVNTGMQQDVGELAAHSCPLERKGSQRRTQVDKAMDSNTSRSTIAGNQPGLPTKSNTVYRRQLATHCLGYRLETKPLTGIIRLYAWREKSEGIETLKQCTDLNIAFERKSVILIECIWVFSMTSYGNGECMHAFRETGTSNHWNLSRLQERGKESSPHQFHLGKAHSNHRNLSRHPEYRLLALQQHENKKEHPTKISAPTRNAKKYCWNQICPKYLANHGSVTANGLTGLVDVLYGLERKSLDLKRLNGARRVDYYRVNRTSQRHKCTGSIEYVSLIGLQNHALQGSGVLARFRDIDFNGYRHCVNPNTPIEAIRNPARQHQSRDVNVGDNPRARTLSFGKEIEGHAIQQGSVRVNNGMQQDIGELATHSSPLERQGNQGHRTRQVNTVEPIYQESESMPMIVMEQSLGDIAWNVEADVARLATGPSYGNGELQLKFREKGPQTGGWEGIAVDVLNNGSQMSQVSGITVADARMEAFDEDYKMTSSAIESHTEYTRQPPSTDVKVCYNSTTRTLSFGKETADQAIQQGNARVNTGMQQDVGELAAHSCPLERKGSQRRTQVDKAMDSNTSRSTIAGNQPGLPTKSNTVYRRQLATHCLGYRLETKPLTGIIRLYAWREKSEGIETLKQCTDLNIAFERKSVILIECIWVFSMTSYGNGECMHAFRETGTSNHWNLSRLQERGKESSPHQFHLGKAHSNHRNLSRHPEYRLLALQQHENKKEHPTKISAPTRNAKKYCWNQICPKYLANHGSVTANGLTGLVDVLYGLERKSLDLKRLNGARRVDYYRVNRTSQRHKCTGSIEYVSLIGLQNHALQGSGVLARFRDIDFNGYRHCVNPNTPIEAIRNPARQHQSRDVNVGDNPRARTLSFGKEIEGHAIQQGSVRVNNGMQQDIGELATHSSPLERQGNQGHRTRQVNTVEPIYQESESMPMIVMEQSLGDIAWNVEADVARLATGPSYGNGELQLKFREKGPQTGGWEGIAVDVLNNGSQMSQVSGITVADARMEAFDEDYKMTSSAIESHTEYTRQPPSTDVKVCYNSTTRTLSFGKETADQAIQQGNARVNTGMQQDVGELAAHSCPSIFRPQILLIIHPRGSDPLLSPEQAPNYACPPSPPPKLSSSAGLLNEN
ncbi:hypothetical protein R3P38DRAFT_3376284 [Favolaschia claudopus]|uniref:Uncharacterized protein n=1 Tax=Favolaschia claudopus TaxID=2862362 RepID=A0AAV9ZGB4_9AGAR